MAEERKKLLGEIMAAIRQDPNAMAQFGADPVGYLTSKGIDTDGLSFSPERNPNPGGEVTDADLAMVAGGGCGSIGYYSCYSEGD
jgi:hypothetical protein